MFATVFKNGSIKCFCILSNVHIFSVDKYTNIALICAKKFGIHKL